MIRPNAPLSAAVLALALVACSKKPPKELPPQPGDASQQTTDNTGLDNGAAVPGSQADFVASVASDTIYFDTDRYNVDSADAATLQSQAQWLARYPVPRDLHFQLHLRCEPPLAVLARDARFRALLRPGTKVGAC